ncbi:restriction endonuclease [Micromonospora ureilytica]|uniref:restriction endonuclease n=1 Tax=Micromonospora ureilytica TaxID=709868 RepID=UPI00403976F9
MRQSDHDELLLSHDLQLARLHAAVELWVSSRDAWVDTWWQTWSHSQGLRRPGSVSQMLCSESRLIDEVWDEDGSWSELCEAHGFVYEFQDHITIAFFPSDEETARAVDRRNQIEWLTTLVAPDIATVYGDVFRWFAENPAMISKLPWRAFEELVASAFAGQGFKTQLGTGRADQGIDLRLLDHPVLGDVLTVAQIKSGRRPVRLEVVQALAAASVVEDSERAILISSSRYLPGAKTWAEAWEARTNRTLVLADSSDVANWCSASWNRSWTPHNVLRDPGPVGDGAYLGKILHARDGFRLVRNKFGLVIRQTPGAVLIRPLRTSVIEGDRQRGTEIPELPEGSDDDDISPNAFLVAIVGDRPNQWHGVDGNLYEPWAGNPAYFDTMD